MARDNEKTIDEWLEDAPMPYDEAYAGSSSQPAHQMPMPYPPEYHFPVNQPNYNMPYAPYDTRVTPHFANLSVHNHVNLNQRNIVPDPKTYHRTNANQLAHFPVNLPHHSNSSTSTRVPPKKMPIDSPAFTRDHPNYFKILSEVRFTGAAKADPLLVTPLTEKDREKVKKLDKKVVEIHTVPHNLIPESLPRNGRKEWCTVHYNEHKIKSGPPYYAYRNSFTIDGTSPNSDENFFAISGQPDTKQRRCSEVRNQLGAGCRLDYQNGDVFMTILSDQTMFVQCRFLGDVEKDGVDTPIRMKINHENPNISTEDMVVKLFDKKRYEAEMELAKDMTQAEASHHLRSFCTTRISFCKGFGELYQKKLIVHCPCWIEIFFTEPHEMADQFLRHHKVGIEPVSSRS